MSVVHTPGMAYDTSTGHLRLIGTAIVEFDVSVDVAGMPGLARLLTDAETDAERAEVLRRFGSNTVKIENAVERAMGTGGTVHRIDRAFTLSTSVTPEPFCDHDRLMCDACLHRCRACGADHDNDNALKTHLAEAHQLDENACRHCGRTNGH